MKPLGHFIHNYPREKHDVLSKVRNLFFWIFLVVFSKFSLTLYFTILVIKARGKGLSIGN